MDWSICFNTVGWWTNNVSRDKQPLGVSKSPQRMSLIKYVWKKE